MKCLGCTSKVIFARGYCQACYTALRRNGTLVRKHMSNAGVCSVDGCDEHAFAKGFCAKHYQQQRFHPLHGQWRTLRSRAQGAYPKAWDSFDAFLVDVGERPSPKHQLRRINALAPWSKDNAKWLAPVGLPASDPEYQRLWHIKNKRGLPDGALDAMFDEQQGKCKICALPLGRLNDRGEPIKTCIDHNHKTGHVRGLLCDPCNKGLGMFCDSVVNLRAGVAYMEENDD